MRGRILWLFALGLAAAPTVAGAGSITWTYSGAFNNAGGEVPFGLGVGSPYTLSITLDDSATVLNECIPGDGGRSGDSNCIRQYSPESISIQLDIGQDCDELTSGDQPCTSGAVNMTTFPLFLRVGNDFYSPGNNFLVPTDFIAFRFYEATEYDSTHWQRWTFFLSSTNLSSLTGLGLPGALPAGASLNWGVCTASKQTGFCDTSQSGTDDPYFRLDDTNGVIPSVPEPGTLALLGLGLAGLGLSRRRKAN